MEEIGFFGGYTPKFRKIKVKYWTVLYLVLTLNRNENKFEAARAFFIFVEASTEIVSEFFQP